MSRYDYDYILVGGGLQNGLIALALANHRPQVRVCILEATERFGGNHTWSFHTADIPAGTETFIEPLIVASWPAYEVRFAGFTRVVPSRYATITAAQFDAVVRQCGAARGWDLRLKTRVAFVASKGVTLESSEVLTARCVIDSRGPSGASGCGFQKFLGLEVELSSPWSDHLPVVIDATIPQDDGFHFMYILPLAPTRVLVEDTYFSDGPELDHKSALARVEAYLTRRAVEWRVLREESGVLPMPWQPQSTPAANGPLVGGYAGGWFHPATGYSFPIALRLARAVASVCPEAAYRAAMALAHRLYPRLCFARLLNWLLFKFVPPDGRRQVFSRLYRTLPPAVLARFYALEFTPADAARILLGHPPRIDLLRPLRRHGSLSWFSSKRLKHLHGHHPRRPHSIRSL